MPGNKRKAEHGRHIVTLGNQTGANVARDNKRICMMTKWPIDPEYTSLKPHIALKTKVKTELTQMDELLPEI